MLVWQNRAQNSRFFNRFGSDSSRAGEQYLLLEWLECRLYICEEEHTKGEIHLTEAHDFRALRTTTTTALESTVSH
jgi:hypothetical protein